MSILNPFRTFGGVHAPHKKNTSSIAATLIPPPKEVIIPLSMHIGAPAKAIVNKGDAVFVGTKIAEAGGFMSAPIHSSVSGTIAKIEKVPVGGGQMVEAVVIKSDEAMSLDPNIKAPEISDLKSFIDAVRESGLVGLGGAGFPTSVKLSVPDGKVAEFLIINGAECEPYITADHREMLDNAEGVLDGIAAVMKYLNIPKCIIGIESNKPDAISHLDELIAKDSRFNGDSVEVLALKARYPQGAEKVLIQAATGRIVPEGKLPIDSGAVVMNVASIGFLGNYLKTGMPLVKKRITVDGKAISEPKNLIVPIGTKLEDVFNAVGGFKEEAKKIIMGGLMMGNAVASLQVPVMKQTNAVLALNAKEAKPPKVTACCNCGGCLTVCPMHLMPVLFERYTAKEDLEELKSLSIMTCIECGCCSFQCPSKRPLVESIRLGKTYLRNEMTRQKQKEAEEKARLEAEAKAQEEAKKAE